MRLSRLGMFVLCMFLVVASFSEAQSRVAYNMTVYPTNAVIKAGQSLRFTAVVTGQRGSMYTPTGIVWYANGGRIGKKGLFVAGSMPGSYTVTAKVGRFVGVAQVRIKTFAPQVHRVVISPNNPRLRVGDVCQFRATAYDMYGRVVPFRGVWNSVGGGTINANGYFRATNPGTYAITVKAHHGSAYDTTRVIISRPLPSISRLDISPDNTRVYTGKSVRFSVIAYDRYGRPVSCNPIWSTNGGVITPNGTFRAGYTPGFYKVFVKDANTGATAIANVSVLGNAGPIHPPHPPVSNARIIVSNVRIKHIFFKKSRATMDVQVFGRRIATLKIYGIKNGRMDELEARACKNGHKMSFALRFSPMTSKFEFRLYDRMGNVLARLKRSAR